MCTRAAPRDNALPSAPHVRGPSFPLCPPSRQSPRPAVAVPPGPEPRPAPRAETRQVRYPALLGAPWAVVLAAALRLLPPPARPRHGADPRLPAAGPQTGDRPGKVPGGQRGWPRRPVAGTGHPPRAERPSRAGHGLRHARAVHSPPGSQRGRRERCAPLGESAPGRRRGPPSRRLPSAAAARARPAVGPGGPCVYRGHSVRVMGEGDGCSARVMGAG